MFPSSWDALPRDIIGGIVGVFSPLGIKNLQVLRLVNFHWCSSVDSTIEHLVVLSNSQHPKGTISQLLPKMSKKICESEELTIASVGAGK